MFCELRQARILHIALNPRRRIGASTSSRNRKFVTASLGVRVPLTTLPLRSPLVLPFSLTHFVAQSPIIELQIVSRIVSCRKHFLVSVRILRLPLGERGVRSPSPFYFNKLSCTLYTFPSVFRFHFSHILCLLSHVHTLLTLSLSP